ncbi:MAG: DUF308 domain-containing protein [Bacteroidales bacterium]|nr:DUF308 domain-containing protein [Bacteroidales bacterium]MBO5854065.1 DUF308 domain-containing protein [Bacteroidales bacterium]
MKTYDLHDRAMEPVRHWWMYLIIGVLAFVLGVFMLTNPSITYEMMTLLLGLALVVFGIIELIVGLFSRNIFVSRAAVIIGAILNIVLGILLAANPGIAALTLPLILGMWMLYQSFMIISYAGDLKGFKVKGYGLTMFCGIVLLVLAVLILLRPITIGMMTAAIYIALSFIIYGLSEIVSAFRLKSIHNILDDNQY